MKRMVHRAVLAAGLAGCVWLAAQAQTKSPSPAPTHTPAATAAPDECPTPYPQGSSAFRTFRREYALLGESDFRALRVHHSFAFSHTFSHEMALRDIADLFWIYGYDYIGAREGYMIFYRRPLGWVQTTSLPRLSAPNGELLPPLFMPSDMDPQWPSPWVLTHSTPFAGAIALSYGIVAYPCSR